MVKVVNDPKIKKLVKDLSAQGLSIAEIVEETGLARSTVNRIRRAANVPTITETFKKKYEDLNELIKEKNKGFEFFERSELREQVGLPKKAAPSDKKYKTLKLETPNQKHIKAFRYLTSNLNTPASELTDLTSKVAALTKTSRNEASTNLSKFSEYIEFKSIANKLNNPAFKSRIGDKTLKDVIEITENVSLGGTSKLAKGNTPENFIIKSALKHVEQGGDKVEFIKKPGSLDKNGNLIKVTDSEFNYKGKKYSYDDLTLKGRKNPVFKEVYKSFDDLNDLLGRETINPITKEKVSFRNLMTEAYAKGAGYSYSKSPYDIDHFKSVKNEPFTNLRILPRRINTSAGVLDEKGMQAAAGVLKEDTAKQYSPEFIEKAKKKTGYNYTKNITQLFNDEVKLANDILTEGRELRTPITIAKEAVNNFVQKVKSVPGGCRAVVTRALGGPIGKCEAIIKADPEKAALKLNNAITATKGPLKDLKEDSQKLVRLYRGERANAPGTMAKYIPGTSQVEQVPYSDKLKGRFFTTNLDVAKSFADNKSKIKSIDIPEKDFNIGTKMARRINIDQMADQTILPKKIMKQIDSGTLKYNSELGAFENLKTQTVAPQAEIKQYAVDNPMEVKVGEPAKLPKANKSVLKTVGKTLAAVGAPLPTALLDTYFINEQVKQGKTTDEIVSNPLNWLGLATMSPLSRAAGIDKAGKVNTALRLGLNPGTIRGISRFVGLPGLALSTAMTAYDQYTKYKNQEGFIYKLFNKEES